MWPENKMLLFLFLFLRLHLFPVFSELGAAERAEEEDE